MKSYQNVESVATQKSSFDSNKAVTIINDDSNKAVCFLSTLFIRIHLAGMARMLVYNVDFGKFYRISCPSLQLKTAISQTRRR